MDSLLMKNVYTNIYVSRMCANILKNVSEFVNEWVGTWIKRGCLRYKVLRNLWWARVFNIIFCGNMNESDFSLGVKGIWFTAVSLVFYLAGSIGKVRFHSFFNKPLKIKFKIGCYWWGLYWWHFGFGSKNHSRVRYSFLEFVFEG